MASKRSEADENRLYGGKALELQKKFTEIAQAIDHAMAASTLPGAHDEKMFGHLAGCAADLKSAKGSLEKIIKEFQ
ncbi:MAG TPA: hypothetical protein VGN88_03720 [Phycisphaerae bacterium]